MSDVLLFVRVRQVRAVPGQQELAIVIRSQGKMEGIALGLPGHEMVLNIGVYDVSNLVRNGENRQINNQIETFLFFRMRSRPKLFNHGNTRDKRIPSATTLPPIASPVLASDHLRLRANLVIEARYGRFDVHSWAHILFLSSPL